MEKSVVSIDISAKLEQWERGSAVAASNDFSRTLWISPEVKQRAKLMISGHEPPQYALMSVLAFMAVQPDLHRVHRIVLDQDYSGTTATRAIIRRLVELIRLDCPHFKAAHIRIAQIAGSRADRLARQVYVGERKADTVVTWCELEGILRKSK